MKTAVVLAWMLVLCGCAARQASLDRDTAPPSGEESIVVIGITPGYGINLMPGRLDGVWFRQSGWRNSPIAGVPTDGYVVGKAPAGDLLAITTVYRVDREGRIIVGSSVGACGPGGTVVFEVPKGKVLYIGDFKYQLVPKGVAVQYAGDFDAAKKYVDERYPKLAGRLERWRYQLHPTGAVCR